MCGIAGIVTALPGACDLHGPLGSMQRAMRHRGPDGEGAWLAPSGAAGFSHARLAIVDLTPAGRQPMTTPDGRFTIVHNGEIYNALELRRELEAAGVSFRTRTDTEVVLRAYEVHGAACVERLRGMFAFAVWDDRERACFLARDPFGIKPLYYYDHGDRLVFASETRALVASGLVPRELDGTALYGYFRTGSVPEPSTLLRGVTSLASGHLALWQSRRLRISSYWTLQFAAGSASGGDHVASTREALAGSVDRHFVSDVPVGIFLSGGVDSTALLALARQAGYENVRTLTISLPGTANDEGEAARRTAAHFGATHDDWQVDGTSGRELFADCVAAADQPSIDGLNTFAASKLAHDRGMKVVLSGVGADELFGGYPSFERVPRLARWHERLSKLTPARRAVGRLVEQAAPGYKWRRLGDLLGQEPGLASAYATFRGVFTRSEAWTLARHYSEAGGECPPDDATDDAGVETTAEDAVSRLEFTRYLRNQLLRDGDAMSMAWGVELRTPFLDLDLVRTLGRIPAAVRLRAGKQLLVDAVPEIPAWVTGQPKRCFQLPLEQWLAGEWNAVFAEVDRTSPVPADTWYRKYAIHAFEAWWREGKTGAHG